MSLFASAFETGISAGPSNSGASAKPSKSNKRKRPSTGAGELSKDDQLRATQNNLEKLMKSLESGGIDKKERAKEGTQPMGVTKKKKRKEVQSAGSEDAFSRPKPSAFAKPNKGDRASQSSSKANGTRVQNQQRMTPKNKEKKVDKALLPEGTLSTKPSHDDDTAGMTDMQRSMKAKLEGARFRWINEQLYSTPSTEAVAMMKKDPKIFADYHMTHRVLTSSWPEPPLPYIVDRIDPLPRGTVVADLGCGDAGLARALVPKGKIVMSYDLVGDSGVAGNEVALGKDGWVVQADFLEHIPLPGRPGGSASSEGETPGSRRKGKAKGKEAAGSEIVDVAVCCLSLMGTNWVGGIYEVCRILKQGGTFHVAEVTSRFTSTEAFTSLIESFGFDLEDEESPSTHFTLFRFKKSAPVPQGIIRGQQGWEERAREGEDILQACLYKKR